MTAASTVGTAIAGVERHPLDARPDGRGTFTEIYRREWAGLPRPVQWNLVSSRAGVVRGVHVHVVHDDYVVAASGRLLVGLRDLRRASPTCDAVTTLELAGDEPCALTIPRGVAHGFWFAEPSLILVGVDRTYDPADELEVHWLDADLGIPWPRTEATQSARDREAGPLRALLDRLEPWQPF